MNVKDDVAKGGLDSGVNPRQISAAKMLAEGKTRKEVAGTLRVHEMTVTSWSKLPGFQAMVDQFVMHMIDDEWAVEAIQVIRDMMHHKNPWVALDAAKFIYGKSKFGVETAKGGGGAKVVVNFGIGVPEPGEPDRDEGEPEAVEAAFEVR